CWSAGASEVGCGFCATLARESRNRAKTSRLAGFAKFIEHISLSGRIPLFILTHRLQTCNRVHHVRHGKNVENFVISKSVNWYLIAWFVDPISIPLSCHPEVAQRPKDLLQIWRRRCGERGLFGPHT